MLRSQFADANGLQDTALGQMLQFQLAGALVVFVYTMLTLSQIWSIYFVMGTKRPAVAHGKLYFKRNKISSFPKL